MLSLVLHPADVKHLLQFCVFSLLCCEIFKSKVSQSGTNDSLDKFFSLVAVLIMLHETEQDHYCVMLLGPTCVRNWSGTK
jgi:hypothetical protein